MNDSKSVLFLLPDCPGYFTALIYEMAKLIKEKGYKPVFASTSPFYENFKKIHLADLGNVYYLSDFFKENININQYLDIRINHWSYFSSFIRQTYFFKRQLNGIEEFKKTKLFFDSIIAKEKINLLVSEGVSNSFLYLAYEQAEKSNIPYFGFMSSRIPYHFSIHTDVEGNRTLINDQAPSEYIPSNKLPDYMKNSQFGGLFNDGTSLLSLSFLKEIVRFLFLKNELSIETGNTKHSLYQSYKISLRRIVLDFYYRKIYQVFAKTLDFSKDKISVIYPLHFHPEASTSVFAKYYAGNEYNVIRNIAFSLPENATLIVKEHKSNVGNNSVEFYKKIKKLPNVVLLDPYYQLKNDLHEFDAVVTLTSTMGFEALTLNVPVYVLGDIFYQNYPGCYKVYSFYELEEKLKQIKKKEVLTQKNNTYNLYSRICFPGSFNYMNFECLNTTNISYLIKPILDYLTTNNLMQINHNIK